MKKREQELLILVKITGSIPPYYGQAIYAYAHSHGSSTIIRLMFQGLLFEHISNPGTQEGFFPI